MVWASLIGTVASFQSIGLGSDKATVETTIANEYAGAWLACNDEADRPEFATMPAALADSGAEICWITYRSAFGTNSEFPIQVADGVETRATLWFFEDRLYRIDTLFNVVGLTLLAPALEAKYGPATSITSEVVTTRAGAPVETVAQTWAVGESEVVLKSPDNTIRQFSITYRLPATQAAADAAITAAASAKVQI